MIKTIPPLQKIFEPRQFVGQVDFVRPFTTDETAEFLQDTSDLDDTVSLWNEVSGVRGLLDVFVIVQHSVKKLGEVFFDFESGRWRYVLSGRLVPIGRVKLGVLRVSNDVQRKIRELTLSMVNGTIAKDVWYRRMRKILKDQYRASWIASIGGIQNYDKSQQALFGRAVAPQYRFLDNFLDGLNTGQIALNQALVVRAGMYARAGNDIYQNNLLAVASRNGMTQVKRVLGPNEAHCENSKNRFGCIELALMGWVNIQNVIPIGDATCLTHCLCSYEFRS